MPMAVTLIAPMKRKTVNSISKAKRQASMVLLASLLVFVPTTGKAQVQNQKRLTSIKLGEAHEGSRVIVMSDAGLSDYEAFKRGDWFYVKIPGANYSGPQPSFYGQGFDTIQVQKMGDGVMLSFRLQPGTTARVNQSVNRLDVIFSAPTRGTQTTTPRVTPQAPAPIRSTTDYSGPTPPSSRSTERRFSFERPASPSRAPQPVKSQPKRDTEAKAKDINPKAAAPKTEPTTKPTATTSAKKTPSSTSINANQFAVRPLPSPTPTVSQRPAAKANWKERMDNFKTWARLNWAPLVVWGLIILGLLATRFAWPLFSRRRSPTVDQAEMSQPKTTISSETVADSSVQTAAATEPVVKKAEETQQVENQDREVFEL
jgi:hypothetical protein